MVLSPRTRACRWPANAAGIPAVALVAVIAAVSVSYSSSLAAEVTGDDVATGQLDQNAEIAAFLSRFIRAFEDLDMPAFIECFSDDATVFYPPPEPRNRYDGRDAVERHFQQVFAAIRQEASSGPPYHRIQPEGSSVQLLGPDAAVVTFHLRLSGDLARRTLVLRKERNTWFIAHLHASL